MTTREHEIIARGHQADIVAWGEERVVKLFRSQDDGCFAAEEAHKTAYVRAKGYPAPAVFGTMELEGRQGFVMERLDGGTLTDRLLAYPDEAAGLATTFADLHAQLALLDGAGLPTLRPRVRAKIERAPLLPRHRDAALRCLASCPAGHAIVHADFHPMNILRTPRGPVVIDWFGATQGHPAADVARTHLMIATATLAEVPQGPRERLLASGPQLRSVHLERYLERSEVSRADVRAWMRPMAAAFLATEHDDVVHRDVALLRALATGETNLV